jgi:hypothetical protein
MEGVNAPQNHLEIRLNWRGILNWKGAICLRCINLGLNSPYIALKVIERNSQARNVVLCFFY